MDSYVSKFQQALNPMQSQSLWSHENIKENIQILLISKWLVLNLEKMVKKENKFKNKQSYEKHGSGINYVCSELTI